MLCYILQCYVLYQEGPYNLLDCMHQAVNANFTVGHVAYVII